MKQHQQKLEADFRSLSMIVLEKEAELQALRDWKAKARPFLLYAKQELEAELEQFGSFECVEVRERSLKELTELLGGDK